jgi:hypothetical protein
VGNGIRVSEAKSLDLALNFLPRFGGPAENNTIAALKMRPQLVVA